MRKYWPAVSQKDEDYQHSDRKQESSDDFPDHVVLLSKVLSTVHMLDQFHEV